MLFAFLLLSIFTAEENQTIPTNQTDINETDPNSTIPDTHFSHPTTAGVIVTMCLGMAVIIAVVMPMCVMRQPDDMIYDPTKPLLVTPNVEIQ